MQVNLPRVRYPHLAAYSNKSGFHEIGFELVIMSKQDLSTKASVRETVLQYTSDICFVEAFVADFMHQLYDCVGDRPCDERASGANDDANDASVCGSSIDAGSAHSDLLPGMFYVTFCCNFDFHLFSKQSF